MPSLFHLSGFAVKGAHIIWLAERGASFGAAHRHARDFGAEENVGTGRPRSAR
jgi:hypothetical protein